MNYINIDSGVTKSGKVKFKVDFLPNIDFSVIIDNGTPLVNAWLSSTCVNAYNSSSIEAAVNVVHAMQKWLNEGRS